ncbi:AAA family ATPase [Methanobacterium alcaliphilum]|uniref:AAA family ATPase n=1 Tax=Methanobacterium alcaliphilum TaxID=392018 RepID=UPI00200A5A47|nr:MoxR family ATPase [Methanobacterium alcaliphilum]MCK9151199.1 MoxR family ATPase [Methanobacterium alcaliphilum]
MESPKDEMNQISKDLLEKGYIPDEVTLVTLFLALNLKKPLLVEGPPGTGKTELSKKLATATGKDFFRVQCYEGITFEQIVGEWNYQKQLLHLEMSRLSEVDKDVFQDEFFIKRPLLSAFINKKPSIILIDEIDKADEEVESFLLQALGEQQITVNDLGTFDLKNDLMVFLTSNSQRNLLDETKDRCLYLYIDYPSFEREMEIVKLQVPSAPNNLIEEVVNTIQIIREMNLIKKPSIRATIDWVKTLLALGKNELGENEFRKSLGVVVKNQDDQEKVKSRFFNKE